MGRARRALDLHHRCQGGAVVNQAPVDRRLQLQIIFAFMFIFAILLFVGRPDPTRGQVIFRVAMAIMGLVGFAIVSARKR